MTVAIERMSATNRKTQQFLPVGNRHIAEYRQESYEKYAGIFDKFLTSNLLLNASEIKLGSHNGIPQSKRNHLLRSSLPVFQSRLLQGSMVLLEKRCYYELTINITYICRAGIILIHTSEFRVAQPT